MDIQEYKSVIAEAKGRRSVADSLIALENTQGWKVLKLILEDRREYLQRQINDIYNTKYEDVIKKRMELYYINELLNMPHTLSEGLITEEEQEHDEEVYD